MTPTRATWIFVLGLTVIRLALLGTTDLEVDEAHYWMWSERLAPAYFSKGPGVAFAIRASTALFGPSEFGVRFFSPILAAGTSLMLFYFGRRLFTANAAMWMVLALNVTPIFNIGAFVMTIDPLSIFLWTAAMITFWWATEKAPRFSWYWPIAGALVGLGFLSKYTNALELVSVVLVLALAPRLRSEFRRPGFYVLLGVFAVFTLPPLIWNSQHAWITLSHLESRGSLEQGFVFHFIEPLKFVAEHFLFYSPLLFLGLFWAVVASWGRVRHQFKVLFLFWFGLPVFLFYLMISINKVAAPNWDALAFISLGLVAVNFWRDRFEQDLWLKYATGVALGIALFMSALALDSELLPAAGLHLWRRDPSDRLRGWKTATAAFEKLRAEWENKLGEKLFLIADDRSRASEISFYLRDKRPAMPNHPPVYLVESQAIENQFSFWPRYDEFVPTGSAPVQDEGDRFTEEGGVNLFLGRSALFVRDRATGRAPHNIEAGFEAVSPIATIEVRRFGEHVRTWQVFLCQKYRPVAL
jgi:4-amino-4-deoxy-L-arabinose transferase-like glycosyltransferase